jgi:MerR family transcriptional regulator, heat shock protein HspR
MRNPRAGRASDPSTNNVQNSRGSASAGSTAGGQGQGGHGVGGQGQGGQGQGGQRQGGQGVGMAGPGAGGAGRSSYPLPPGFGGPAHDDEAPVYVISIAAELAGMHPQTLRSYDRLGLVTPGRTAGRGRRYSARDVALLREVQRLSQEEGINLEGIRQILHLGAQVLALQAEVIRLRDELAQAQADTDRRVAEAHQSHRRDLVPLDRGSIVVWRPGTRR